MEKKKYEVVHLDDKDGTTFYRIMDLQSNYYTIIVSKDKRWIYNKCEMLNAIKNESTT